MANKELRGYQVENANMGCAILKNYGIVYVAQAVRTGKTAVSFEIARIYGAKRVLFLTKKKAISSIQGDYEDFGYAEHFEIMIVNDESMHKVEGEFDIVIHDEHHRCFLGETKIDGVPIMNTDVGDFKKSFNFVTGEYEYKRVKNVFKNKLSENLIKIKCNGKEIVCTESHEIFTKRGWVKAKNLRHSDELQVVRK